MQTNKMLELNKIHRGDWIKLSKKLDDEIIDMIVTSPPYWSLQDYGVKGQLGLEQHPKEYIKKLVDGFNILKDKLKKSGSVYLNLGDTYFGSCGGKGTNPKNCKESIVIQKDKVTNNKKIRSNWLQPKQKMLVPHRIAIALQDDGWICRNDIIWAKPNPLPSSVKDRLNTSFELVFHFVRSKKYFYDLDTIREPHKSEVYYRKKIRAGKKYQGKKASQNTIKSFNSKGKNPGDVFKINTRPFPKAHFAVYPVDLLEKPVKSSLPDEGVLLDPFCGAATSWCALLKWKSTASFIGFELQKDYIKISYDRIKKLKEELKLNHKLLTKF